MRRSPPTGLLASLAWCARRSTWAHARSSSSVVTPRSRTVVFGSTRGKRAASTRGRADLSLPIVRWKQRCSPKVRSALDAIGLWDELGTEWFVLDCELLPWSAKAEDLLRRQYAAVGASGSRALRAEAAVARAARSRGVDVGDFDDRLAERVAMLDDYITAYGQYCWPIKSIEDLKLAPFQLLAGEGETLALRDHEWHLEVLGRLCETDASVFRRTKTVTVDVNDEVAVEAAVRWWEELTATGGEGMVVKPVESYLAVRKVSFSPVSSAAAASTCGSSTDPSTRPSATCRGFVPAPSDTSVRLLSGSLPSASRLCSVSSTTNLSIGCTSASSGSLRLRASRSTLASRR